MKINKNWGFILLLSLAALSLAGTAAYFSVFGLSKLFAAAGLGITILAASLEFAKLVTVSYVYRFWKHIKKSLRGFYIFAVVFIMLLTSIGIYGFLTGAYQQSANKLQLRDSQIEIAQNKKDLFVNQLNRINQSIESASSRINTLSGLRSQQEQRLDNLYDRNSVGSARRTETQIEGSDQQINMLNNDISNLMKQTNTINDSIAYYDQKIAELNSSEVSNEIGPYKFVAQLTGISVDSVVNIVALLIVVVFDPLAVTLLIGVNQLTLIGKKNEEEDEDFDYKKKYDEIKTPSAENIKHQNNNDDIIGNNHDLGGINGEDIIDNSKMTLFDKENVDFNDNDVMVDNVTTLDELKNKNNDLKDNFLLSSLENKFFENDNTNIEVVETDVLDNIDNVDNIEIVETDVLDNIDNIDNIEIVETDVLDNIDNIEIVETDVLDNIDNNELEISDILENNTNVISEDLDSNDKIEDIFDGSDSDKITLSTNYTTNYIDVIKTSSDIPENPDDGINRIASITSKVNSSYFVSGN